MLLRTLRRLPAAGRTAAIRRFAVRTVSGAFAVAAAASAANAQYFGGYDACCPCQQVCQPCQQMAMVVQPCYQQVPVTEMQEVKQTVMRPVAETEYVEQQYTEYRPVTETKTAEIPVTSYQPVTEMQTVCQDRSYYQTYRVPNCRMSPCQYDGRPGLIGWLNRTGYEMRSAFTPKYTTYRQYVPNQVAMQVPTTRYVAQQGTRQVTYNVTKYEPHTATRQVAVQKTRMVAEEVTVSRPVTTYRTVPVGTTVAYAPIGSAGGALAFGGGGTISNVAYGPIQYNNGGTATAFGPSPDPISTVRSRSATRSAENTPAAGKTTTKPFAREAKPATPPANDDVFGPAPGASAPRIPRFKRYTAIERDRLLESRRLAKADAEPAGVAAHETFKPAVEETSEARDSALAAAFVRPTSSIPFAVRSVRWTPPAPSGPALLAPSVASVE